MPVLVEKDVQVYSVTPTVEISTGEALYQIQLGEYIKATAEVAARIGSPPPGGPKEFPVIWMLFNVRAKGVLPYKVGSKWKMTVNEDGSVNLVIAQ